MNILMNLVLLANVVVGILFLHWTVIVLFAVIHAVMRYIYVRQENSKDTQTEELQRIQAAMPAVRHAATVVSSLVVAAILYGVGYGARALVNMMM